MNPIRAYGLLAAAAFRSELQHRGNFLIMAVGGLCYQGLGLAFIWAVLERFDSIAGWSLDEIALLYAIRLTAHALWLVPFSALLQVDELLRDGEYDRFLLRPVSPLIQVLSRRTLISGIGDLAGGLALLVVAGRSAPVDWTAPKLAFLPSAVVGGALVEAALQLMVSALAFRARSMSALRLLLDEIISGFGNYPLSVFDRGVQFATTFVLPLAFIAYLPTSVLLGRPGEGGPGRPGEGGPGLLVTVGWVSPVVGVALFGLACWFWRVQSRHYTSTGS